jgi:hypothetical protein
MYYRALPFVLLAIVPRLPFKMRQTLKDQLFDLPAGSMNDIEKAEEQALCLVPL